MNNYYDTEEQTYSQFVKELEAINFALRDVVAGQLSLKPILIASFVSILPVVLKSESHGYDPSKNSDFSKFVRETTERKKSPQNLCD